MADILDHDESSKPFSASIQMRIRILILASTLAVALVFGLTFYFALISSQSALARQVPELGAVAAKLKSQLVINTLIIAGIIIVSFLILARLITERMFSPLEALRRELMRLAGGALPRARETRDAGPFGALGASFGAAMDRLLDKERTEIDELVHCSEAITRIPGTRESAEKLGDLIKAKKAFAGITTPRGQEEHVDPQEDTLFMQPR